MNVEHSLLVKSIVMLISLLLALPFGLVHAFLLNEACREHPQCSVMNSVCIREYEHCPSGLCKCKDGYINDGTTECNMIKHMDEECPDFENVCSSGAICTGYPMQCKCRTDSSFNHALQMCIDDNQELIGGTCSDVTQCLTSNSVTESVECAPMPGASSPSYCKCKDGYIQTSYACRLPQLGETCTRNVGCKRTTSTDQSVSQLSCTDSLVCLCDQGTEPRVSALNGFPTWLCMANFTGGLIADGHECTSSTECQHKTCVTCPGDTRNTCVIGKTSGTDVSGSSLIFTATMVVFVSKVVSL